MRSNTEYKFLLFSYLVNETNVKKYESLQNQPIRRSEFLLV
jgi:hypothetical protein